MYRIFPRPRQPTNCIPQPKNTNSHPHKSYSHGTSPGIPLSSPQTKIRRGRRRLSRCVVVPTVRVTCLFFNDISHYSRSNVVRRRSRQDLGIGSRAAAWSRRRPYHWTGVWVDARGNWVGNLPTEVLVDDINGRSGMCNK